MADFMTHQERVEHIFDIIEDNENPLQALDALIEDCGDKEIWDFDPETISADDFNRIHLRKTAKFMRTLISQKGCEEVRRIMSKPF